MDLSNAKAAIRSCVNRSVTDASRDDWHKRAFGNSRSITVKDGDLRATIHQLRVGHCPLLQAYAHRIGIRLVPQCQETGCRDAECVGARCNRCFEEADSAEHFLVRCPKFTSLRRAHGIRAAKELGKNPVCIETMARWLEGRPGRPPDYTGAGE